MTSRGRRQSLTASFGCGEAGCAETGHFSYSRRDGYAELYDRHGAGRWRCIRHYRPDDVLSPARPAREVAFVLGPVGDAPGLYWVPENSTRMASAFASGPGWKAFASDFPAGTRIVCRVEAVPPAKMSDPGGRTSPEGEPPSKE